MKNSQALLAYQILSPMPLTKFSETIQSVLFHNYLALYDIAEAHDDKLRVLESKLKAEGVSPEDIRMRKDMLSRDIKEQEAVVDLKKVSFEQFRAEATKCDIPISCAAFIILKPMFE